MKIPILHINQFQKLEPSGDFYANSFANHMKLNSKLINKPHSHNFYLCVMFTVGTGTHEIDFNSYTINPGKVFMLKPGQTHFWKFDSEPEGFIFFHSQEFYELTFLDHTLNSFPFFSSYQNPPLVELNHDLVNKLEMKFQELYSEHLHNGVFKKLKITTLLNSIYVDLTRAYAMNINTDKMVSSSYLRILEKLENLIDLHFYNEKFPTFYANKLNITTKHLNRVVKQMINKTTSQLISERIILEAKRLIVHSNSNLTDIANTLEFSDYAYFSKVFKLKTGLTPLDFKKQYS